MFGRGSLVLERRGEAVRPEIHGNMAVLQHRCVTGPSDELQLDTLRSMPPPLIDAPFLPLGPRSLQKFDESEKSLVTALEFGEDAESESVSMIGKILAAGGGMSPGTQSQDTSSYKTTGLVC